MAYLTEEQYKALQERGADYDLIACLEYNDTGLDPLTIGAVLAVVEGANDCESWYWILSIRDEPELFVALTGWCDYTGWDCQSGASVEYFPTAEEAAASFNGQSQGKCYHDKELEAIADVGADLLRQLEEGKAETWREKTDKEMGL